MSVGFDRQDRVVNLGDTTTLRARPFDPDDHPYSEDDLVDVTFTIQHPDTTKETVAGEFDDGSGFVIYAGTSQVGHHDVVATFTISSDIGQEKKSVYSDFEVIDPFNPTEPTVGEIIRDSVWIKLQDCFDAEDEGPWLRDMTLNFFGKEKFAEFIDDALFDINQYNPPTHLTVSDFIVHNPTSGVNTPTTNLSLLVQAVFLQTLRHMMRSYVEQPLPQGAQVAYEDRRDYLQRWAEIYQIELAIYEKWVHLFKRSFLQLGHAKGLVSSKAGRLLPGALRTRFVGRGYF